MAKNIVFCVLGTLGFCVLLNSPKHKIWIIIIGSLLSSSVYEILNYYTDVGVFWSTLIAAVCVEIYSEIMARVTKTAGVVILIPSTIPLLPGGSLYYSMTYLLASNSEQFFNYFKETIFVAFALALGAVISLMGLNIIRRIKQGFTM